MQRKYADLSTINDGAWNTMERTFAQTVSRTNVKSYVNQTLIAMGVFLYFEGWNVEERGRGNTCLRRNRASKNRPLSAR
jgi:hypothetical protein